ncbi:hypothetical protein CHLNCDRAFT_142913 [Chlorella variabilis]|uniref:Major facilitator superfamily (MFS) profile domain-containing protein n=1 Tax=Chlorella variabilis TaxID=554065 RepID=E1Z919_CHLVA|nr:hypothetical protein CHLNCDRAFT_142913 [Chlorella variabilis]EFN57703.1 hypothetical protein CHLNCDRAFT_142913 [Chlorella variabilis]|eukprot:XP_005849805.1 hypothetical protein CHLNCDRAFT_142913 [Chlorella variabilis]
MTALFTATAALLYADQNLLAPNLTAIAEDFGFDDQQRDRLLGGFIAAAFFGVGAPAALLFGWLSDRVNRCRLLFAAVMLVSSIVQLSTGVGLALGQGIAGFVVSCVMLLTCREPLRGGTEAALQEHFQDHPEDFAYSEQMTWRKLGRLLLIKTNVLGLFGCLPWGMILVFLNDFMSQDKGLTVQQATLVLLVLGIGGGVGVVGGGCLGQWLYNRQKWSMPAFIGTCTILGVLPMYALLSDVASAMPLTIIMAMLTGALSGTVGPNMR